MQSFAVILSCICPCLVWLDVANVKHYLNAIKAKQSALNACSKTHGRRFGNPTSAVSHSSWSFGPSSLAPIGIHHLLLSNLATAYIAHRMHCGLTCPSVRV